MALDPGALFNALSGLLLMAMGLFVGSVKPRTRVNTLFAVFGTAYGLRFLGVNLLSVAPGDLLLDKALLVLAIGGAAVAAAVLPFLAMEFPDRFPSAERRRLVVPALMPVAMLAVIAAAVVTVGDAANGSVQVARAVGISDAAVLALARIEGLAFLPAISALLFFLFVLAVRFRLRTPRTATAHAQARQFALVSAALGLYPGYIIGTTLIAPPWWFGAGGVAALLLLGASWLWNTKASDARDRRIARNAALFLMALPLTGFVAGVALGGSAASNSGLPGASRVLGEAVLAYAILRHQLLGIDVKVRWTIKRGTVAGVFLGVFFVASQVAQNYFSNENGPLIGGAAAGLLLFAIAPLQRAAERLADKAVPGAETLEPVARPSREEAYKDALRIALQDRRVTRDEEARLTRVAEHLGIGASRAVELLGEVEDEARVPSQGGP
jgi:hypothetical protein